MIKPMQRCPLCNTPAEYQLVDRKNSKHYYCTKCGDFQIAVDAEKRLESLEKGPTYWKIALPKLAKAHPYGYTLTINLPEDKDLVPLFHKYVKNSELPR